MGLAATITTFIAGLSEVADGQMHDLTAFQRDVLYVIAGLDERLHGLAIKAELEDYYDEEVNHGRLYPNLDTLVDKGLVEKGTIDKRTNSYELSARGTREIEGRQDWEAQYIDDLQADEVAAQVDA